MYAREINGEENSFGVSGKLIRNVLVMYDRRTESLWSQLLGEAVAGEMQGTKLEFLPSWHTTWKEWQEMHPKTLALKKSAFGGSRDPYDSYYTSGAAGVIGETYRDDRLTTKEFVIGVEVGNMAIAYPFRTLNAEPVVNDSIGGEDILVAFDADGAVGAVFSRRFGEQTLTFSQSNGDGLILEDAETGSTWEGLTGRAIDGPLAGENLERIKSTTVFWFGWKDFYNDTLVYGLEAG